MKCDVFSNAVILQVDDRPKSFVNCSKIGGLSFGASSAKVFLLPGKHSFLVRYWVVRDDYSTPTHKMHYTYSKEGRLFKFDVKAGASYFLRAEDKGDDWTAKLEKQEARSAPR